MKPNIPLRLSFLLLLSLYGCKKNWLDVKPDSKLVVLSSVSEYQSLLDNPVGPNGLGEIGSDDYFVYNFTTLTARYVELYKWAPNGYGVQDESDWTQLYKGILTCNTALDGLSRLSVGASDQNLFNQVYGTALFQRGFAYCELAQTFIKPYDSATASTDMGLPLRLDADISQATGRSTVQQTYDQIIADLKRASQLLPASQAEFAKIRPDKAAAFAYLARVYMSARNYNQALVYADSALNTHHTLLDYNTLTLSGSTAMPHFDLNPEVIWYGIVRLTSVSPTMSAVDSSLYQSYAPNDLRKKFFFRNASANPAYKNFIGSYYGYSINYLFLTPAVDELYLIRAECKARQGLTQAAMDDLNTLLAMRWATGTFSKLEAASATEALRIVLTERRKELVMRGTRFTDLRRLNSEPAFATPVTHIYQDIAYTLVPNDPKYVWPIPDNEILYSGIAQNKR